MKQFIIEVPEDESIEMLTDDVKAAMTKAKGQFASGLVSGTQAVNGYKLKLVMVDIELEAFEELLSTGTITTDELTGKDVITPLNLDWVIVASDGVTIKQSLILPYMIDTPLFDELGDIIGSEPVTDITDKLQTYSGRSWSY